MAAASLAVVMAGSSIASAYGQASAIKMQNRFQQQQLRFNQQLSNMQAEDAIQRGEQAASQHAKKVKEVVGQQRTAMAAQGINLDEGTALDIQEQTYQYGMQDAMTIKNNAYQEAWGYKVNSLNMATEAQFKNIAAKSQARNTLLVGGLQALSYGAQGYASYKANANTTTNTDGYSGLAMNYTNTNAFTS